MWTCHDSNGVHVFAVNDNGALVERWGDIKNPRGLSVIFEDGTCRTGAEARVGGFDYSTTSDAFGYSVFALSATGHILSAWWNDQTKTWAKS